MTETNSRARRGLPWRVALLGLAALALALVIGTQVIGVLYSIIAPPRPPLPPDVIPISHTSLDYGVDDWLYGTDQTPCDLIRFYEDNDTDCYVAADTCGVETASAAGEHITQCVGTRYFSLFAMRWKVIIAAGYQTDGATHFRLTREIYWTGSIPPQPQLQP